MPVCFPDPVSDPIRAPFPSRKLHLGLLLACTTLSAPAVAAPGGAPAASLPAPAAADAPLADPTVVAADEGVVVVSPDDVYILEQRVVTSGEDAPAIFGRSTGGGVTIINGEAETSGDRSVGIFGEAEGEGRDSNINAGTVITRGEQSGGIVVRAEGGYVQDSPYGPLAYGNAIVTSQDVRTSGAGSIGIAAESIGGAALVTSNKVETEGDGSIGIQASGDAFVAVTSETVTTAGTDATGIHATSSEGGITVDSGSVATTGAGAAGIVAEGYGNVTVVSDSVSTGGDPVGEETPAAVGILASSEAGNVVVESGTISTKGRGATGIEAYAYGGVTITSGSIAAMQDGAKGIDVSTVTGAVNIDSGTVDVSGNLADGINVVSEQGRVKITSEAVTTRGDFSSGIKVVPGGSATIDSGTVATTGDYAMGIEIFSTGGDVTVASGAVTTDGLRSNGISAVALTSGGDIDIQADSVATGGFSSDAIYGNAGSSLTVNAGALSTRGEQSTGVFASAYDAISITVESIATEGPLSAGISAIASGGTVAVDVGSVTTAGDSSVGVYAGGLEDVTVNAGSVVTSGDRLVRTDPDTGETTYFDTPVGIAAYSYSGDIVVNAENVATSGYGANGITSYSVLGTSTITIDKVTTAGERAGGVRARGGTGATVIADVVETHGYGIDAGSVTGEVLIKANQVSTTSSAYAQGIELVSIYGSGRIESGTISTVGKNSSGISLLLGGQPGYSGDGVVISGSITTEGENSDGIRAEAYVGSVAIESGSIDTAGYDASGIDAMAGGNVAIASQTITTSGTISDGIKAVSQLSPFGGEPGSVSVTSQNVSVSGDSSRGIVGLAEGNVTIASGTVATTGGTAAVESLELVCDDETGYCDYETVRRPGPRPVGILAESTGGSVTVTSGSVTTRGREAHGIHALTEAGDITIASGDIRVVGGNANAIRADSASGDIAIAIDGDVSAARAPAVEAVTDGIVHVSVASGGLLRGSGDQFALAADAASAEIRVDSGGTLSGSVSLTGGGDVLEVSGLFDARGESRFGAGEDLLVNGGNLAVQAGTVRFADLEQFRNAGLVTLADGDADDVLDLTGTAFEGASGSAVRFDVVAGAGDARADQLVLGDVSGVTEVQIAMRGPATLGTRADLITVNGESPDGAFVLDPDFADAGFLRYRLVGAGTGTIALATAPDREIFEVSRIAPAAAGLWRHGAEAWSAHRLAARDAGEAATGRGIWGQAFTGDQTVEDLQHSTSLDGETYAETLSIKEKFSGLQFGGDILGGPVRLGVTAGYGDNDVRLRESGNEIKTSGFNVGAYGGWSNRLLFVDVLGKVDFAEIELDARSAGVNREFDATIFGLRADAGLRFAGERFFAEPMVSLAWTNASLDDFEVDEGEFGLGDGTGLLGQAGLRAGGRWALGDGYTLRPSGGLFAVKELNEGKGLRFQSGTAVLAVEGDLPDLFARAEGGLTLSSGSGWDISLRGQGDFGSDVSGAAFRAGFNWRW